MPNGAPGALTVDPVAAAPGHAADVVVRLRNPETVSRAYTVMLLGLDDTWSPVPVRTPVLLPGQEIAFTLTVTPAAGSPAGRYGFAAVAQPVADGGPGGSGQALHADGTIELGDSSSLGVELLPADPAAVRTKRVRLLLTNRGTTPMSLHLSATAAAGLDVWLRDSDVTLDAGESMAVRGRLTVRRRRWTGQARRLPFVVTGQGNTVPVRCDGVFQAHPVLNRGVTRIVAGLVVISIWAAVALVALGAISRHAHKTTNTSLSQVSGADGGGAGGAGGGAGGASGSGSGGAGGSGSGAAGGQSTKTRLNGTVSGASPGGVHVTIRPTALFDEQTAGTTFVGAAQPTAGFGKLSAATIDLGRPKTDSVGRDTTTAADGSFALAGIAAPGYYLVQLAKRGYQTAKFVINAQIGQKLPTLTVPLTAGQGHLSGRVVDKHGTSLGGAHVVITNGAVTLTTNTPTHGAVGTWSVGGLSTPGTYLVSASRDGYDVESAVLSLAASGSAKQDITLKPGLESVVGTIKDSNGNGVGGATISATNGTVTRTVTSVTDVGSYVLPALPLGGYTLSISAPGFAPQSLHIDLDGSKPGLTPAPIQLTTATATLTGIITDRGALTPAPLVPSAGLVLTGDAGTYKTMSVSGTGEFTFAGVAPGDYTLSVESFRYLTNFAQVTLHAGDDVTAYAIGIDRDVTNGVPNTARISGSVVDAHTGAKTNCPESVTDCPVTIKAYDDSGTLVATTTMQPGGTYTLPAGGTGLLPGLYRLTFSAVGYEPGDLRVQVPVGTTVAAAPVALVPEGILLGHVSSPGDAVTGCVVAIPIDKTHPTTPPAAPATCPTVPTGEAATTACTGTTPLCTATIKSTGDFEIDFVPSGTYWMFVIPTETTHFVPLAPATVTVSPGQTARYDVTINRFATVDVVVQEPNSSGDAVNVGAGLPVTLTQGAVTLTANTGNSGIAAFSAVPQGTWTLDATDAATSRHRSLSISVGLNQALTLPLVLVQGVEQMVGHIYGLSGSTQVPITGAKVIITGVVDYSGSVPHRVPVTVETDDHGCFAINNLAAGTSVTRPAECGGGLFPTASVGDAGFVVTTVDLVVDPAHHANGTGNSAVDRFASVTRSGFQFQPAAAVSPVILAVPTTAVAARLVLDPDPAANGAHPHDASVLVTQLPPGAGNVTVSVRADGTLAWSDPSLSDTLQAKNAAVPGTYHLRASLDGFDPAADYVIVVPPHSSHADDDATVGLPVADVTATPLTLHEHGGLLLTAQDSGTSAAVNGAVFTVSGNGVTTTTVVAAPTSNQVTVPDLSPAGGPYTVTARASGYHFDPQSFSVVSGVTTTATVLGNPLGTLVGTLLGTADGVHTVPLAGATVRATRGSQVFSAVTDTDGGYRIVGTADREGLVEGVWSVTATAFGYTSGSAPDATVPSTGGDVAVADLTLTATPVDVTVTVQRDGSSATVGGATVQLLNASALSGGSVSCVTDAGATTPPHGSCGFTSLPPTTYSLVVTAPGFAPLSTSATLQVGVGDQRLVVTLAGRTNTISGTVVGHLLDGSTKSTWTSADGLSVQLTSTDPANPISLTVTPGSSSATGVPGDFTFSGVTDSLSGTNYVLTVTSNASTGLLPATRSVAVAGGQVASVEILLQPVAPTSVTVSVTSTTDRSMAGAAVTLLAADGTTVVQTASPAEPLTAGATPSTVFNQVAPGTYRIRVDGAGGHLGTTGPSFAVASTPVTQSVSVSEQLLQLTATSVRGLGAVAPVATFTITNNATSAVLSTTPSVTADNETVELYVPAAAYTVAAVLDAADASGYSTAPTQSVVQASGSSNWIQSKTFSFTQSASLTVTVTGTNKASTVTVTGGGLSGPATCSFGNGGSNCTVSGLTVAATYSVSVTTTDAPPRHGSASAITILPGTNSLTIAVA